VRNVWKGLIIGGLTGVAAGVVLDSLNGASKKTRDLGKQVREHAPEAGRWIQSATEKAGDWIQDSDIPEHVRDAAERIKDSGAVDRAAKVRDDVTSATRKAVSKSA